MRISADGGAFKNVLTEEWRRRQWLWAVIGASAIWLGFPCVVPSLPLLALFWPVALWRLGIFSRNGFSAFRWGLLSSFAGSLAALYWLSMPVAQVGGLPWPGAIGCACLIALVLATQGGFFSVVAHWLGRYPPQFQAVMLALVWYFLELSYALIVGFPWLPLAGALAQWPIFIQPAAVFGAYLTGALWLCGLFLLFVRRRVFGMALLAALLAFSGWKMYSNPEEIWPGGPDTLAALIVEGNVDQNQKWTLPFQERSLRDYLRLTEEGVRENAEELRGERPLVIWPETALPFFYEGNKPFAALLEESMARLGYPLLFGAPGMEKLPGGEELIFNRVFLLNGEGRRAGHYDKERLVPFGEYLPAWLKLDFLEALLQGVGVYERGTATAPLTHDRVALGVLICYEGIFPWLAQKRVESGANILVDVSNDGWFGLSPASRQHLYLTALRCVEQGRYMFRGTNTGISAVIDAQGRVVRRGGQFVAGSMLCRGRLLRDKTVYHRMAVWWPLVCGVALASLWSRGRKKHVSAE